MPFVHEDVLLDFRFLDELLQLHPLFLLDVGVQQPQLLQNEQSDGVPHVVGVQLFVGQDVLGRLLTLLLNLQVVLVAPLPRLGVLQVFLMGALHDEAAVLDQTLDAGLDVFPTRLVVPPVLRLVVHLLEAVQDVLDQGRDAVVLQTLDHDAEALLLAALEVEEVDQHHLEFVVLELLGHLADEALTFQVADRLFEEGRELVLDPLGELVLDQDLDVKHIDEDAGVLQQRLQSGEDVLPHQGALGTRGLVLLLERNEVLPEVLLAGLVNGTGGRLLGFGVGVAELAASVAVPVLVLRGAGLGCEAVVEVLHVQGAAAAAAEARAVALPLLLLHPGVCGTLSRPLRWAIVASADLGT